MNRRPSSSRAERGRTRREPWPWLLAAGPAIVVVASFVTLALAVTHDDGLVAANYYKLGLTINRTLAAQPVPVVEGDATLTIDESGSVRVHLAGFAPSALALSLHAPGGRAEPVALARADDGDWHGDVGRVARGRQIVTLVAAGFSLPVTLVERVPASVSVHARSAPS